LEQEREVDDTELRFVEVKREVVWPSGERLSDAERMALAKLIDDMIWDAFKTPPQPETSWPPWRERCPKCGPIFKCAKHMVWA
jgi:hypothetical protein